MYTGILSLFVSSLRVLIFIPAGENYSSKRCQVVLLAGIDLSTRCIIIDVLVVLTSEAILEVPKVGGYEALP